LLRRRGRSRHRNPQRLERIEHALRRRHLYYQRLAGLEQALQTGHDRGPSLTSAGEDIVAQRPDMGLGQRQLYRVAHRLDLVTNEGWAELFDQRRPVDVEG